MSSHWPRDLIAPLAEKTKVGGWNRVEEDRRGGWLLRREEGEADAWYRWHEGSDPVAVRPLLDERLPQLVPLVDGWLAAGYAIRLLAHRVGSRVVFQLQTPDGVRSAKVYRKDRDLEKRWRLLEQQENELWTVPRIVEWNSTARLLVVDYCPGESLNTLWQQGAGVPEHGRRIATLLDWLEGCEVPADFPRHGSADEIRILEERLPVLERVLAEPPVLARTTTKAVVTALAQVEEGPWGVAHRDLHDKQVLIDGARGALIDLDLCARAPVGLDRGNILAHIRLRALQGLALPWREIAMGVARPNGQTPDPKLCVWTAATLTRLGLIYCRRLRRPGLLEDLFRSANDALHRRGEWSDLL